jgi:dipeptidyl aminopeptidase/acylaminoacyl peptidase
MMPKSTIQRCFSIILTVMLVACGKQAAPTIIVDDTALSAAFTEFAQTPTAMPTLTVGPTNTQDLFSFPTVSFSTPFTFTPGPSPTLSPTNTPRPTVTLAPTRTLIPLPFQVLEGLRVAYNIGGNLYVQDSGRQAIQLTHSGQDDGPTFSDDGQKIVFYRGEGKNQLWSISINGTGEQTLITPTRLAIFGEIYTNEFMQLRTLVFVPGTHQLLFNTHIYRGRFDPPEKNNDLLLVDTDTGEMKQLLAPGQGGDFLVSPDGKRIAVQARDHIDVIDLQGQIVRQNLVMYPVYNPPAKVPMAWMPNSRELIVLPSKFDPSTAGIPVLRQVWRYSLDGNSGREIPLDPSPIGDAFSISPDGNWIAYSYEPNELDPDATSGVYLGNLRDGTSRLIFEPPLNEAGYQDLPFSYDAWSPDNIHFIFSDHDRMFLGNIRGEIVELGRGMGILGWIDNRRYLFEGGEVVGKLGTQERVNIMGPFPYAPVASYDPVSFVFLKR